MFRLRLSRSYYTILVLTPLLAFTWALYWTHAEIPFQSQPLFEGYFLQGHFKPWGYLEAPYLEFGAKPHLLRFPQGLKITRKQSWVKVANAQSSMRQHPMHQLQEISGEVWRVKIDINEFNIRPQNLVAKRLLLFGWLNERRLEKINIDTIDVSPTELGRLAKKIANRVRKVPYLMANPEQSATVIEISQVVSRAALVKKIIASNVRIRFANGRYVHIKQLSGLVTGSQWLAKKVVLFDGLQEKSYDRMELDLDELTLNARKSQLPKLNRIFRSTTQTYPLLSWENAS